MSKQQNDSVESNGQANEAVRVFTDRESADQANPQDAKRRLFLVTGPDGSTVYTWAKNSWVATVAAAHHAGFKAAVADRKVGRVGKVKQMAADLAAKDAELAALREMLAEAQAKKGRK
jgi:hypothetical protein